MDKDIPTVASHYNSVPNTGLKERSHSKIYYLRNFNNWVKSCLIADTLERLSDDGHRAIVVLDLCCGKGGDLLKWKVGRVNEIVMVDMAEVALDHCRERYDKLRGSDGKPPFLAHFIKADASMCSLISLLPSENTQFDLCSCQFALHYSFGSEQTARMMLENAAKYLKPGGYFIGTIPNASIIVDLLRQGRGSFHNDVCSVEFVEKRVDYHDFTPPLFGAELNFLLGDVVDCPEYLAYFKLIIKILEEFGMELVYHRTFPDLAYFYQEKEDKRELLMKMDALEAVNSKNLGEKNFTEYLHAAKHLRRIKEESEVKKKRAEESQEVEIKRKKPEDETLGTLSMSEWEVACMYSVFMFRRKL